MMVLPQKHDKRRPRLWLRLAQEHASQWTRGVPVFLLCHRGGEPAESIELDALVSPIQPSVRIEFEPVAQIAKGDVRLRARLRVPEDGNNGGNGGNGVNWVKRFFEANCLSAEAVNYPVHLRFRWDARQDEEWLNLIWDAKSRSLRDRVASART